MKTKPNKNCLESVTYLRWELSARLTSATLAELTYVYYKRVFVQLEIVLESCQVRLFSFMFNSSLRCSQHAADTAGILRTQGTLLLPLPTPTSITKHCP